MAAAGVLQKPQKEFKKYTMSFFPTRTGSMRRLCRRFVKLLQNIY